MKYGLVYYYNTTNIGDDILTYAAKRFLPQVDYYIDREALDTFIPENKEYVSVILNGWYLHNTYAFPPSPYIVPLFIGIHFNKDIISGDYSYLDGNVTTYLQKYGPVGCRDRKTLEALQAQNIKSFFSGCLTLTLKQYPDVKKTHNIVLTDVPPEVEQYVRGKMPERNIISMTHKLSPEEVGKSWQEREIKLENYLKTYQGAELVITSRLHCALPSIALGTPVILIGKFDEDYYDRLESFASYYSCYSKEDILEGKADVELRSPGRNADAGELVELLESYCVKFMTETTKKELCVELLPEPKQYKELYVERTNHMRAVISCLKNIRFNLENQHLQDVETMEHMLEIIKKLVGASNDYKDIN